MRRNAEIARHSIHGASLALRAAFEAARAALPAVGALTILPDEEAAIRQAAETHLERCRRAVAAVQAAVESGQTLMETVDKTATSRVGLPVVPQHNRA